MSNLRLVFLFFLLKNSVLFLESLLNGSVPFYFLTCCTRVIIISMVLSISESGKINVVAPLIRYENFLIDSVLTPFFIASAFNPWRTTYYVENILNRIYVGWTWWCRKKSTTNHIKFYLVFLLFWNIFFSDCNYFQKFLENDCVKINGLVSIW